MAINRRVSLLASGKGKKGREIMVGHCLTNDNVTGSDRAVTMIGLQRSKKSQKILVIGTAFGNFQNEVDFRLGGLCPHCGPSSGSGLCPECGGGQKDLQSSGPCHLRVQAQGTMPGNNRTSNANFHHYIYIPITLQVEIVQAPLLGLTCSNADTVAFCCDRRLPGQAIISFEEYAR